MITKSAPNVRIGLVSDRLKNKLGDYMNPSECADIHASIIDYMGSRALLIDITNQHPTLIELFRVHRGSELK